MQEKDRRIIILGGGTFQHIRNHLSLCTPAFGSTAKKLHELIPNSLLVLTKMADSSSSLVTNEDVEKHIDSLLKNKEVGTIILNVAFCDFKADSFDGVKNGAHAKRLKTKNGSLHMTISPTQKIIGKIRKERPDIFLVGFKTTTNQEREEQFLTGLKMMKKTKCNLVLANDVVRRFNMIITLEETTYGNTTDRESVLKELSQMIIQRNNLTYTRTTFFQSKSQSIKENSPKSFRQIIQFLISNGGFIENNGNGFTPGHFCFKLDKNSFLSSQRKADHNLVFTEGMSRVVVENDKVTVWGERKASVGAKSQWIMLESNPDYDCIIHTHNPLKNESKVPVAEQKPFQCGSTECGLNTKNNLKEFVVDGDVLKAVYLEKHGINILFKSSSSPKNIIQFIKENVELGIKTT